MKINKKTGLRTFDIEYVRSKGPCYAPERHLKAGVRYSAVSILQDENISFEDRLWVVLRKDLCSEKLMRLFAVWCARQVLKPEHDKRLHDALEVATRFAEGKASAEELSATESEARAAALAAELATESEARAAAWSAARSATESEAWSAARAAVQSAAESEAWPAARAAIAAAQQKQCEKLIEMFWVEGKERLVTRKGKK